MLLEIILLQYEPHVLRMQGVVPVEQSMEMNTALENLTITMYFTEILFQPENCHR